MLINQIYYHVRPLIPRALQIILRRGIVNRKKKLYRHVWPIDEKAGRKPEGWSGWPDQKQFALVLMHDVDTEKGHKRCRQLVQMDEEMGFRSLFSFVPEGYNVSPELRRYIVNRGFEVGVHGLRHDGKLYLSGKKFYHQAIRINDYLKNWKSVGFISPSMHRNLDWNHELNIEYDVSTFDTDPFEPQPDGMATIFPFFVHGNNGKRGYVELPYTLPQDFTLFVLMKEKNIDIWKKKLDWIAERGGMALLITHPDYMNYNNGSCGIEEYPVEFYKDLLDYIKGKFDGRYWNPLPKEMAHFWKESGKSIQYRNKDNKRLRACMVAYTFYDTDNRVKRYAETLIKNGFEVDVIALKKEGQGSCTGINGVNVYRIQKRVVNEKDKLSYIKRLLTFFLMSSLFLAWESLRRPYDIIHVHNVPDFEVFAAVIPKLAGSSIILDIHDILPEFYAGKFNSGNKSFVYRLLLLIEKLSAAFSDHVIISNHLWEKTLVSRSVKKDKCTTILNYPDPSVFYRRRRTKINDKFIIIYPGTINRHQGLDIAVNAFAHIKDEVPETEFHIYGGGPMKKAIQDLIDYNGLHGRVFLKGPLPSEQMAAVMANAELGVVPKRNDSFGGDAFSTKIFEFMALGVPVVAAATRIDLYYFNDSIVRFFEPGNESDLAIAIRELVRSQELRERLASNAGAFVTNYTWDRKEKDYLSIVGRLVGQRMN